MSPRGQSKAVQDGRLLHTSVSQIKTYLRCPRLWAGEKIFGLVPPRRAGQDRGVKGHQQMEAWYLHGTEPTNEAVLAAMPVLPPRGEGLLVEHSLQDPTLFFEDVRFEGHSDLIVPPGAEPPAIYDWKFVKDFRFTDDPATDLQMLAYAYWVSQRWPNVTEVHVTLWYFMAARSTDFKPRPGIIPVEAARQHWFDVMLPAVQAMRALVQSAPAEFTTTPGDMTNDYAACRKYGGCHHRQRCGVDLLLSKSDSAIISAFDAGLGTP